MTMTSKAMETAGRNLAQRIDRYLQELEKWDAKLGWREADHLLRALDHLQTGTFGDGERDMMWAEWATGTLEFQAIGVRSVLDFEFSKPVAVKVAGPREFRRRRQAVPSSLAPSKAPRRITRV